MSNCWICITKNTYKPICGCEICLGCVLSWFEEKSSYSEFSCPNEQCTYQYSLEYLIDECREQPFQEQLQVILMKQYLKNSDIRPCPNGQCNNYGYVDLKNFCDDLLECQECGMKWKDLQISSYAYQLNNIKNACGVAKNFLFCFIATNECPKCGCNHMTCKACNEQFCWECKQNWIDHNIRACRLQFWVFFGLAIKLFLTLCHSIKLLDFIIFSYHPLEWVFIFILANYLLFGVLFSGFIFLKLLSQIAGKKQIHLSHDYLYIFCSILIWIVNYFLFEKIRELFNIWIYMMIYLLEFTIWTYYIINIIPNWLSFSLIALPILYFLGMNGVGMVLWLKYYWTDISQPHIFLVISYVGLFLWNIFDLWNFLTSYSLIMMVAINLCWKRNRGQKYLRDILFEERKTK